MNPCLKVLDLVETAGHLLAASAQSKRSNKKGYLLYCVYGQLSRFNWKSLSARVSWELYKLCSSEIFTKHVSED